MSQSLNGREGFEEASQSYSGKLGADLRRRKPSHLDRGSTRANLRQVVVHLHPQSGVGRAAERFFKAHGHFRRHPSSSRDYAVQLLARNAQPGGSLNDSQAQRINVRLDQTARMTRVLHH
jgi:hypothetical protein